jgi:hypothetical protein
MQKSESGGKISATLQPRRNQEEKKIKPESSHRVTSSKLERK